MREIITDTDGRKRFKGNKIVQILLETSKLDMNNIVSMVGMGAFSEEGYREFCQLIGYSVDGYEEIFEESLVD